MSFLRARLTKTFAALGPRYMPFADVTTPDLTLRRLLRLSLFQISVAMTMVLLVGTLNRVMIVELGVPAAIVGVMIALPLLAAPFRALIGYKSDTHRCELGWRRVPFMWKGTMLQFGGFAIMPFALLVLAGKGNAADAPVWIGQAAAALSFLLVGTGAHMVQTAGLALATDLTPAESHPRVVGLMYITLLLGMMGSALVFGALLADFNPGRLVQVIQGAAVTCILLNGIALWKQEARNPPRGTAWRAPDPSFGESWRQFCAGENTVRRLVIVGLGTMAFGMADVILEPYGGQILNWTVAGTTKLTALLALGGLLGFAFASSALKPGTDPYRFALLGAVAGLPAFVLVILAAPMDLGIAFLAGNFLIGFGAAVFGHATLTATMTMAPKEQAGLALGAWGAVQATAAGLALSLSGLLRDIVSYFAQGTEASTGMSAPLMSYLSVYAVEITLLLITIAAIAPLLGQRAMRRNVQKARSLGQPVSNE